MAGCEFKTRTTPTTVRAEQTLALTYGNYQVIDVSAPFPHTDSDSEDEALYGYDPEAYYVAQVELFKKSIRESAYRAQIMHCLASSGLDDWLYVTAAVSQVIRVVHIRCNEETRKEYLSCISWIRQTYFSWVYDNSIPVPTFKAEEYKHCIDDFTLKSTLALWRALKKLIEDRQLPIPEDGFLLPSLIAYWNRIKGGIDVFSRHLKNVHAQHNRLNPYYCAVWLRMIMALVYNAHRCYSLLQSYDDLMNTDKWKSFKAFNKIKGEGIHFKDFC